MEGFHHVVDVVAPEAGPSGHITYIQIAELLFQPWMSYLVPGLGLRHDEVFGATCRPIVREGRVQVGAAIGSAERLSCGVRAVARTRRAFTLEQVLWRPRGAGQLASGSIMLVTIDPTSGVAVEIPSLIWDAVEAKEGRAIA